MKLQKQKNPQSKTLFVCDLILPPAYDVIEISKYTTIFELEPEQQLYISLFIPKNKI